MRIRTEAGKEKDRETHRRWLEKHRAEQLAYKKRWNASHRERQTLYNRRAYVKLRCLVLDAYGGKCSCCGLDDVAFLTIDHVRNNGQTHRKICGDGTGFYQWLKKHGFPKDGLQVLCMNCNWAKGMSLDGQCPHKSGQSPRYIPPL